MKKIIIYTILFLLHSILITSCNDKKPMHEQQGAEHNEAEESPSIHHEEPVLNHVELSEQKFINAGIVLGAVEARNLKDIVKCNGILTLPPQSKANISSLLPGIVKNVNVIEGDYVKKGYVLATLLSTQAIQLQEEYIKTKDNLVFLEKEFLRQKELMESNVTSGKKFQQAESDYKSQKGRLNSLRDQLNAVGLSPTRIAQGNTTSLMPVVAPIEGSVKRIDVNIGTYVETAKEMFEIVDLHHIHIDLQAFENDFAKIKVGQRVFFTLPNQNENLIEAVVFATGKAFENNTRSTTIHAEIKNNKNKTLIPGMYVNSIIEVGSHKVPSVPVDAVVKNGGKEYVFIFTEKKKEGEVTVYIFEMKEVKTGVTEEGYVEIKPLEEIPNQSKVVMKGAYFLAAEMKKGEGGEHEH